MELNNLEISILERLSTKYSFIKDHIPHLKVRTREITGVGMYVNFIPYDYPNRKNQNLILEDASVSTNDIIKIAGLKNGLGYEVDISNGKLQFIELVTYGEAWDGEVPETFSFVD